MSARANEVLLAFAVAVVVLSGASVYEHVTSRAAAPSPAGTSTLPADERRRAGVPRASRIAITVTTGDSRGGSKASVSASLYALSPLVAPDGRRTLGDFWVEYTPSFVLTLRVTDTGSFARCGTGTDIVAPKRAPPDTSPWREGRAIDSVSAAVPWVPCPKTLETPP